MNGRVDSNPQKRKWFLAKCDACDKPEDGAYIVSAGSDVTCLHCYRKCKIISEV